MNEHAVQVAEQSACEVAFRETDGWRRHRAGSVTVWLKGYSDFDGAQLAKQFAEPNAAPTPEGIGNVLLASDGHFALAATGPGWAFAAVDWVRSIPLATAKIAEHWLIDDQPERLRQRAGLGAGDIDTDAALSIAMAGYTIDDGSLYRGIHLLVPGEIMWFAGDRMSRRRYYTYRPWQVRAANPSSLRGELKERTLAIVERMLGSLNGRTLVVPLSAGRDSRLIVSAARHIGYKNVRCFTYGRADNFEAKASRAIAEKLGYPWAFVPATIARQRRFFEGGAYRRYLDFADSGASVPFVQDMAPLLHLKKNGYVPNDAVIANGNSGDYISGNHILPAMRNAAPNLSEDDRWRRIIESLLAKHFSLWQILSTPAHRARMAALLRKSIERAGGALGDPQADHGLYEYAEFQDRQCKYVITGQRIYEFLGHDWRLPLWENSYLRFWEGVPLAEKAAQALYARMLQNADWGGVWRSIPINRKSVRPRWLIPLRLLAKAAHVPLGANTWHEFERRYLQYWMEATCNPACVPYSRVWRDRRGARNHIAWLAEAYLGLHGVTFDRLVSS
jgi:asparagine synthase (glutamine-hydrolysing)